VVFPYNHPDFFRYDARMDNARKGVELDLGAEASTDTWDAHWRRIGAWSIGLAAARGLTLQMADDPLLAVLDAPKCGEFLQDLGVLSIPVEPANSNREREIFELARALEHHFAFEPFRNSGDESDPFAQAALQSLQCATRAELDRAIASLPVFPAAGQRALQLLISENWSIPDLEFIAASDPVLASDLIRVCNSCLFCRREPVTTLGHAIAYLGSERASAVLIAASVKRLFTTPQLREIWNHSIEASEIARNLAAISGRANAEEAFLGGLVHDIGRLATALLPAKYQSTSARLLREGCELSLVERALCGSTHAELGATALQRWNFPRNLIEAVRFHHRPEACESSLAAVLYLTERCTNPAEDIPSAARSKAAIERLGFDRTITLEIKSEAGILDSLRL